MCRFSVNSSFQFVVVASDQAVQKRYLIIFFDLLGELYVLVLSVKVFVKIVYSVFVNQRGIVCEQVARACSAMFCMTISATTTETGEPIAVPCNSVFVVFAVVLKVRGSQTEVEQVHNVVCRQWQLNSKVLNSVLSTVQSQLKWNTGEQRFHVKGHQFVVVRYLYCLNGVLHW